MRLRIAVAVMVVVLAGACISCTQGDSDTPAVSSSGSSATETAPPSAEPSATVEVTWFWATEDPLVRFVAEIGNPGDETLEGIETEWVAYDADNAIVGSNKTVQPMIAAGETIQYVGGAGGVGLSGIPARVEVRIVDSGRFVEDAPPTLAVSDVAIELATDGFDYNYVTARVTNGSEEIATSDVEGDAILRNAEGQIVGAGFIWNPEALPETIPADTAFVAEFAIQTTEKPASADVYFVVGPSN